MKRPATVVSLVLGSVLTLGAQQAPALKIVVLEGEGGVNIIQQKTAVGSLKGYRTLVVTPDEKVFVNPTGCAGMATGGTGDVLAGMLAGWLAQLLDAEAACRLAVYLHGAAGELADADNGEVSMTAGDLVDHIGDAILELTARRRVANKSE